MAQVDQVVQLEPQEVLEMQELQEILALMEMVAPQVTVALVEVADPAQARRRILFGGASRGV